VVQLEGKVTRLVMISLTLPSSTLDWRSNFGDPNSYDVVTETQCCCRVHVAAAPYGDEINVTCTYLLHRHGRTCGQVTDMSIDMALGMPLRWYQYEHACAGALADDVQSGPLVACAGYPNRPSLMINYVPAGLLARI
jgi:hypothetical protein